MSTGLSKKTNLKGDIAKKGAVKLGTAPFTKEIGSNHRVTAKSQAAFSNPGGKLSPKKLAGVGRGK